MTARLTETDALILMCLTDGADSNGVGRAVELVNLQDNYDFATRAGLSFDELSFGAPRLVAAGLMTVEPGPDGPVFRATSTATAMASRVREDPRHRIYAWPAILDAAPPGAPEDRTEGRLAGLDQAAFDEAVRTRDAEFEQFMAGPLVKLAQRLGRILARDEPPKDFDDQPDKILRYPPTSGALESAIQGTLPGTVIDLGQVWPGNWSDVAFFREPFSNQVARGILGFDFELEAIPFNEGEDETLVVLVADASVESWTVIGSRSVRLGSPRPVKLPRAHARGPVVVEGDGGWVVDLSAAAGP